MHFILFYTCIYLGSCWPVCHGLTADLHNMNVFAEWHFWLYIPEHSKRIALLLVQLKNNITQKPNVNVNNWLKILLQKWEGERWPQELPHLHTLRLCLCTCSGILHRFDYTTPAFFLKSLLCKRWQSVSKHTASFSLVFQNCTAVKSNDRQNKKEQDAWEATFNLLKWKLKVLFSFHAKYLTPVYQ